MKNILRKLAPYLVIIFVIFVAYGLTLKMYFWQDDSALIFKLQNQQPASGSFGVGIIGEGPYKYLVTPFVLFYPLFGVEPFGYFAVGLLTYILATWAFYFFAKKLFTDKKTAYVATLIFAAGYVGSDIMFRVINSWQTNIGLFLTFLTLERLTDFLQTKSFKSYLLSVILYFACTEFVFIRSHSLVLPIIALVGLYQLIPFNLKRVFTFIVYQIPFLVIFRLKYLSDSSFGAPGISTIFKEVVLEGKMEKLSALFANTGNVFIPTPIQSKVIAFFTKYFLGREDVDLQILASNVGVFFIFVGISFLIWRKYKLPIKLKLVNFLLLISGVVGNLILYNRAAFWYLDIQSVVAGLIGIELSLLTVFWSIILWKKQKHIALTLLWGLIFVVSQVFGYFVQYPTAIFSTTHRYFSYALIGYAVFVAALYQLLKENKQKSLIFVSIALVLLPNLILGFTYQKELITMRSIPSRQFYGNLKRYVPEVEKGDIFYFDIKNNPLHQRQFSDFFSVGSMPETTALAIYYGVDRYDVSMVTEFNELVYKLQTENIDPNRVHAFYYGDQGLIDTTSSTRKFLQDGSNFTALPIAPLTPTEVRMSLRARSNTHPTLPYLDGAKVGNNLTLDQKLRALKFLKSRDDFYRYAKVTTSSEWRYREVENIQDKNIGTSWQGHRIGWGKNPLEHITIDLNSIRTIDRVIWHNWDDTLSAVNYSIETSLDGKIWQEVKSVQDLNGKRDGEVVVENFAPVQARFTRLTITKTLSDDSPAIAEIMVDGGLVDVDPAQALDYARNPFYGISSVNEWRQIYAEYAPLATMSVAKVSDKGDIEEVQVPVVLDSQVRTYTFILPAGGTTLSSIKVTNQFPGEVELISVTARNLSFGEIKTRGLVKRYSTN